MAVADIPEQAVDDAMEALIDRQFIARETVWVSPSRDQVRAMLEGAYPAVVAVERERLAAVIPAERFRKLADWFDTDDEFKTTMFPEVWPRRGTDVQDDLRKFADLLERRDG